MGTLLIISRVYGTNREPFFVALFSMIVPHTIPHKRKYETKKDCP
jgi:hypothetical protein